MTEGLPLKQVFESAATLFGLLSAPLRLKIVCVLCEGEKNVSELLARIQASQSNMSQQLATLYRAGVLARRREGAHVYYRVRNDRALTVCRVVCDESPIEGMFGPQDPPTPARNAFQNLTRTRRGQ